MKELSANNAVEKLSLVFLHHTGEAGVSTVIKTLLSAEVHRQIAVVCLTHTRLRVFTSPAVC